MNNPKLTTKGFLAFDDNGKALNNFKPYATKAAAKGAETKHRNKLLRAKGLKDIQAMIPKAKRSAKLAKSERLQKWRTVSAQIANDYMELALDIAKACKCADTKKAADKIIVIAFEASENAHPKNALALTAERLNNR